jgi:hypothetical protein
MVSRRSRLDVKSGLGNVADVFRVLARQGAHGLALRVLDARQRVHQCEATHKYQFSCIQRILVESVASFVKIARNRNGHVDERVFGAPYVELVEELGLVQHLVLRLYLALNAEVVAVLQQVLGVSESERTKGQLVPQRREANPYPTLPDQVSIKVVFGDVHVNLVALGDPCDEPILGLDFERIHDVFRFSFVNNPRQVLLPGRAGLGLLYSKVASETGSLAVIFE